MCTGIKYALFDRMLKQPHLLIAGATGSGKSVVINGLIYNMLFDGSNKYRFILIDPKRVELVKYKALPHTIKYASEPADMHNALQLAMDITENRYRTMQKAGTVKYTGSNVYIIIDEFADLMLLGGKRIENKIIRIAQIGRAARYHLILATQTVYHTVITNPIKCNLTSVLALSTENKLQSRLIMDKPGCEQLPKYGYGFFKSEKNRVYDLYKLYMYDEKEILKNVAMWEKQK
jgi:S-DNA-T family DNA segregation ATPase FtsK/SpoIIIE